jgi:iron(III) transport system permease protein
VTDWSELGRLASLGGNTALLVLGTLAVAMPLGVAAAVLLYRTDLPGRDVFRGVTILSLFVPLPVLTTAWQAALGGEGLFPFWNDRPGQPWASGIGPAVWVHATAALPWVILIVGIGLRYVEGELEEDALLVASPWCVLWHVTLPRCRASLMAAALWVVLQIQSDFTVADLMQVRTYAEEVYLQLNAGGDDGLFRAVLVSLPAVFLTWLLLAFVLPRWQRTVPPPSSLFAPPLLFRLGWWRWICFAASLGVVGIFVVVPLGSLVWKLGLAGVPAAWVPSQAASRWLIAWRIHGRLVAESLALALAIGLLTAGLALLICWVVVDRLRLRVPVFAALTAIWALPGLLLGFGLKELFIALVVWVPVEPLPTLLYYGPSYLPVVLGHLVRFLPCAVAALWPIVRMIPSELRDAARVEGARPWREFRLLVVPLLRHEVLAVGMVVAALSLAELPVIRLVETVGADTFVRVLFDQMHYGATGDVAALCLVMLATVFATAVTVAAVRRLLLLHVPWRRTETA